MAEEKLTCTAPVRRKIGSDNLGRAQYETRRCGAPANEVVIGGMLTSAKAILCATHASKAHAESFVSENGFPLGETVEGLQQKRIVPAVETSVDGVQNGK